MFLMWLKLKQFELIKLNQSQRDGKVGWLSRIENASWKNEDHDMYYQPSQEVESSETSFLVQVRISRPILHEKKSQSKRRAEKMKLVGACWLECRACNMVSESRANLHFSTALPRLFDRWTSGSKILWPKNAEEKLSPRCQRLTSSHFPMLFSH